MSQGVHTTTWPRLIDATHNDPVLTPQVYETTQEKSIIIVANSCSNWALTGRIVGGTYFGDVLGSLSLIFAPFTSFNTIAIIISIILISNSKTDVLSQSTLS